VTQQLAANGITLLTGATGFIGSHVAERLANEGRRLRCLVRPGRRIPPWLDPARCEIIEASLLDRAAVRSAVRGVRTVIHIAGVTKAKRSVEYDLGNVESTRNLLEAAGSLPDLDRFAFISSLTVAGPSPDGHLLDESEPERPLTAYGRSKLAAERLVTTAASKMPISVIRPPAVYGPRDRDTLEMFRWVRYGISPAIGGPEKSLSLIHVHDLADAIRAVAYVPRAVGRVYYAADPVPHPFAELMSIIARVVGRKPLRVHFPRPLLFTVAGIVEAISFFGPKPAVLSIDKARDMSQDHWVCSSQRLREELGFDTSIPLEEGLRSTYTWYLQNKWL
jgi:nucleoside-diphosphate-sugar epimerase